MALKKSKSLHNNILAEYWKITRLSVERKSDTLEAEISLFINKAASDSGEPPFLIHKASRKFTKEQLSGDITALAYTMFKNIANTPVQLSPTGDKDVHIKLNLVNSEDV